MLPWLSREPAMAALDPVVVHGKDKMWCRVRRCIRVGIVFEPGNEVRSLGDLVGNLAVVALVLGYELERCARAAIIPCRIQSQGGPQGIAAEEPSKTRPL